MRPEDKVQQELVEAIGWLAPEMVAFAIPNASRRTATGRAANAVPGLLPGVWDVAMILPLGAGPAGSLGGMTAYCEVKTATGVLSKEQKAFGAILAARGVPYFVAAAPNHIDQLRFALADWHVPTREHQS